MMLLIMLLLMLLLPDVVTVVVALPKKKSSCLYGRLLSELLCARKSCGTQSEVPRERTEKVISKVVSDGEWKPYRLLIFFRSLVYAQLLCFVGNGFEVCRTSGKAARPLLCRF